MLLHEQTDHLGLGNVHHSGVLHDDRFEQLLDREGVFLVRRLLRHSRPYHLQEQDPLHQGVLSLRKLRPKVLLVK